MKKMLSLAATVIMLAGGLIGLTSASSSAALPPYPGTVDTDCHAGKRNNPRIPTPAKTFLRVDTDGNGRARGDATFTYTKRRSGRVTNTFHVGYQRGKAKYNFPTGRPGIPKGRYRVYVFFNAQPEESVFRGCSDTFRQKVKRRRR